jgi:hypothetical protein
MGESISGDVAVLLEISMHPEGPCAGLAIALHYTSLISPNAGGTAAPAR